MLSNESSTSLWEHRTDEVLELEKRSAIVIQRNFRSYLWRKFVHNITIDRRYFYWNCRVSGDHNIHFLVNYPFSQMNNKKDIDEEYSIDIPPDTIMIGSPRTRNDFKLLESKIQKWKDSKVRPVFSECNTIFLVWNYRKFNSMGKVTTGNRFSFPTFSGLSVGVFLTQILKDILELPKFFQIV